MIKFRQFAFVLLSLAIASYPFVSPSSEAEARERNPKRIDRNLKKVCPRIIDLNPATTFFKNNKPLRASSAINAPVIGYFKQMTLASNAGVPSIIGSTVATMYDSKGGFLTTMAPMPCRKDHCYSRNVSAGQTDTTRRLAIKRTKSPAGYIKLSNTLCMKIEDIGRCYGNEVDKTRALCNQVVG
jgi:hypothetical protein